MLPQLIHQFPLNILLHGITTTVTRRCSSVSFLIGISYFLGSTPTKYIDENPATQFRTLLMFPKLHEFVPSGATILASDLTLTFVNYNAAAALQVCFITKPWNGVELKRFESLLYPLF
jgi:hypothetical protein